ncbi:MAG: radical SAM family heme chaperone HemW, partial [Alphaproteobacteria bacterium]|nr:radical SAM family heme chaperone HemW [Alphaproteobacteria bacterium]
PYCDFNSHVRHGGVDQAAFLAGYLRELRTVRAEIGDRNVSSIFFGGGTPSLMETGTVAAILDEIARLWRVDADAEITLEANPSSVEAMRFAGYRAAGVNRVSLGVQALDDADLRALGRLHSMAEALRAIDVAATNFDRHSIDLIYARPGQTASQWARELAAAMSLGTRHLSLYQLTVEDGTPFAELYNKGRLRIPASHLAGELFSLTREMTSAHGLRAYEISNHARPGEESRHNLLYWRYGEYAGIGPGAHSRLIVDGHRTATSAERSPETWLATVTETGSGITERELLSGPDQADELLMMSMRLVEGLDLARLAAIGGVKPSQQTVDKLVASGLLDPDAADGRLRATEAGSFVLNEIVLQLSIGLEAA